MRVRQVYKIYQTPKSLQEHMLKTAALAGLILDNWTGRVVDKDAILKTCITYMILPSQ